MRRIALYSDVHANLPAFEAVLADIDAKGVTERYCLGDLVGYGPHPNDVVARLRRTGDRAVQGNYDRAIGEHLADSGSRFATAQETLDGAESYAYTVRTVERETAGYLRNLERAMRLEVEGVRILLCHGSPRHISEGVPADAAPALLASLARTSGADVVCCGHTHVPYHRSVASERGICHWINAGAVGRPRDEDPRAAWVEVLIGAHDEVLGRAPEDVSCRRVGETALWLGVCVHRVAYDVDSVIADMELAGLPLTLAEGLRTGSEERAVRAPSGVARLAESAPAGPETFASHLGIEAMRPSPRARDAVVIECSCPLADRIAAYESLASIFRDHSLAVGESVRRLRNAMRSCRVNPHVNESALAEAFEAADLALHSQSGRDAFESERGRLFGDCGKFDPFSNVLSPDELTYLSGDPVVHEHVLERAYREAGFEVPSIAGEPCAPGGIAVELLFVAHCLKRVAQGEVAMAERARAFFEQHLADWAVLLAVVTAKQAAEPVMRYAGLALDKYLLCEAATFRHALPEHCEMRVTGDSL